MKRLRLLGALLLVGVLGITFADNRVSVSEFDFTFAMPAPCLGENVITKIFITSRSHSFTTPSGNSHMIEMWHFTFEGVGESTGREWVGKGVAPGTDNIHKNGENYFFTESGLLVPVSVPGIADGPRFRFNHLYQARWDADGNLVMEMEKGFDPNVRCLGKK